MKAFRTLRGLQLNRNYGSSPPGSAQLAARRADECGLLGGLSKTLKLIVSQEYHNVNRTYSDVAKTLSYHPNFVLQTDVYSMAGQTFPCLK